MERVKLVKNNFGEEPSLGRASLIIQILVWIFIIILNVLGFLLSKAPQEKKHVYKISLIALGAIIFPILLIIYYILEFTSGAFEYLKNIRERGILTNIIEFLKRIFKKEPVISFKIIKTNITYGGYDEKHKVEYMI